MVITKAWEMTSFIMTRRTGRFQSIFVTFCSSPTSSAARVTCSRNWISRMLQLRYGAQRKVIRHLIKKETVLKKLAITICIALVSLLLGGVSANTRKESRVASQDVEKFTHKEAGVQFELPKGWKAKPDADVITVSSADDSLQVVFWVPDEGTFDAAVKDLDKELDKTI